MLRCLDRIRSISLAIACMLVMAKPALPPAEISGLLLDRTFSAAGSAFAREFASHWNELDRRGSFSLSLIEKPEPRGGSKVWVELEGEAIVVVPLSPGRPAPAQAAVEAAFQRAVERALTPQHDALEEAPSPETGIE